MLKALTFVLSILAVAAHPGDDHHAEAAERRAALESMGKRSLSHCASQLAARGVHHRNVLRRRALQERLVQRRIQERDIAEALNTSHLSSLTGLTTDTNTSVLFAGDNECILAPEVTQGPYYVTGEHFRSNVTEAEVGVSLHLDVQIIDTNTCEPLPNVALDIWHCNATGVYAGVVAQGNGDSSDLANINSTFLRGIQATDSDGVVQFTTIFPGHYTGRTTHIHVNAHTEGNWELLANNTISGGTNSSHVGQLFFDQSLISEVEALTPYSTNTQELTTNADDTIMAQQGANIDPVVEYVLLGDTISDGILAWISIGINGSANNDVQPAVIYGENGGVDNSNFNLGQGGGAGGAPPNGTAPNGTAPNGTSGTSASSASAASASASASAAAGSNGGVAAAGVSIALMVPAALILLAMR